MIVLTNKPNTEYIPPWGIKMYILKWEIDFIYVIWTEGNPLNKGSGLKFRGRRIFNVNKDQVGNWWLEKTFRRPRNAVGTGECLTEEIWTDNRLRVRLWLTDDLLIVLRRRMALPQRGIKYHLLCWK